MEKNYYFNETTVARDEYYESKINERGATSIDTWANVNNNFSARSCTIELYTVVLLKHTHTHNTVELNYYFSLLLL